MAQLKLIRASAGSGKTFNLTRIFLELVLKEVNSEYYRKILAVTFTNKATAEMKERILKELYILASGEKSEHLEHLVKVTGKTEARLRNLSEAVLNQILHGYSWFRVETIDTFFQGIIRSFVRELNIPGHYNIELDQDKILEEAVNRLLDKLESEDKLVKWLVQYIDSRISEGKSWVVKSELQNLGKSLFKEDLIENLPVMEPLINDENTISAYRDVLHSIVTGYEKKLSDISVKVLSKIDSLNLIDADFFYKGSGTLTYLRNLHIKPTELPGKRVYTLLDSPDKWASKDSPRKQEVENLGGTLLNPAFLQIIDLIEKESKEYNTANIILKNLHILGLLTHLNRELKELQRDKGIMLISDASPFIQRIINNNDTPFIYEKAGNRFNHILIDEFQDTSSMQWGNFKPLISNSLSNNNDCLLVGDVKQSIYRWRSSNWEILAKHIKEEVNKEIIHEISLTTNWRSSARVVMFNNEFFQKAVGKFQTLISENTPHIALKEIYSDVMQEIPVSKSPNEGHINIKLFNNQDVKDNPEYFHDELIERINEVLANSYIPGDIAILVRNKREGTDLANLLVNTNKSGRFCQSIGVISNESLFLIGSPAVNLLVAAMQFVYSPLDRLVAANLVNTYKQVFTTGENIVINSGYFEIEELKQLIAPDFIEQCKQMRMEGIYSIAEKLVTILNIYSIDKERVYVHSFLDVVFNFGTSEISELNGFLNYWTEEGHKKTIMAAETPGSVKILTIHKSKGLEFPVVIVPFCDWSYTPKTGEKLWLNSSEKPFNTLPLQPVNFEKVLDNSIFSEQYQLENYRTIIDNLNLLYVAYTRAANALIVFARTNDTLKHTGDVVAGALEQLHSENTIADLEYNEQENRYVIGSLPIKKLESSVNNTRFFTTETPATQLPDVRISSQAQQFMGHQSERFDAAEHGQVLHAIMEKIRTSEDISSAIRQFTLQGIITSGQGEIMQDVLEKAIKDTTVAEWFNIKHTILSENDIIGLGGKINRPDKVVIHNNNVSVIDYKFGSKEEIEKHKKQVNKYKYLIKSMGYVNVSGYIWYVLDNNIVEV